MAKDKPSRLRKLELKNIFGYLLFFALLIFVAIGFFGDVPYGLSDAEMISTTTLGNLDIADWFTQVVNLPYHFLQGLSIDLFGLSVMSIRLPSVIIALFCGALILSITKKLYNSNIALIAGLVTVSTVLFITIARTGTPMIMPVFLCLLAIFATARAITKTKHNLRWLVLAGTALALNAYSPMGIYLTIACIVVAVFHPKIRLYLFGTKMWKMIVSFMIWALLLAPLAFGIINDISIVDQLLGLDTIELSWGAATSNLGSIFWLYGESTNGFAIPIIAMAELGIAAIGIFNLIRHFHSARSYLVLPLCIIVLVLSAFNASAIPLLLLPMIFLIASGVDFLIEAWFGLFPRNPYARFIGIASLTVLLGWTVIMGGTRYFEANFYDQDLPYIYHSEIYTINNVLRDNPDKKVSVVVSDEQTAKFVELLIDDYPSLTVSSRARSSANIVVVFAADFDKYTSAKAPSEIVSNGLRHDSEILRIYQK